MDTAAGDCIMLLCQNLHMMIFRSVAGGVKGEDKRNPILILGLVRIAQNGSLTNSPVKPGGRGINNSRKKRPIEGTDIKQGNWENGMDRRKSNQLVCGLADGKP